MDALKCDGATAPSPSFIDLIAKPRGRSRQTALQMPAPLPLFEWADTTPSLNNIEPSENLPVTGGNEDEVTP